MLCEKCASVTNFGCQTIDVKINRNAINFYYLSLLSTRWARKTMDLKVFTSLVRQEIQLKWMHFEYFKRWKLDELHFIWLGWRVSIIASMMSSFLLFIIPQSIWGPLLYEQAANWWYYAIEKNRRTEWNRTSTIRTIDVLEQLLWTIKY